MYLSFIGVIDQPDSGSKLSEVGQKKNRYRKKQQQCSDRHISRNKLIKSVAKKPPIHKTLNRG